MLLLPLIAAIAIVGAVVAIGAAILLRAAFWGEEDMARVASAERAWKPMFVGGDALRDWAADAAERAAKNRLTGKRTISTALQLVQDFDAGAARAMLPHARTSELERVVPCPAMGQGRVGVNAPEAIAIAAQIKRTHSRAGQARIRMTATANAAAIESRSNPDGRMPPPCPLQDKNQICCVYGVRPLRCRALHAIAVTTERQTRTFSSDRPGEACASQRPEETVAEGIEAGVTRALAAAHLDSGIYELNSALAKALAVPDAASRWSQGEDVFGTCHRID